MRKKTAAAATDKCDWSKYRDTVKAVPEGYRIAYHLGKWVIWRIDLLLPNETDPKKRLDEYVATVAMGTRPNVLLSIIRNYELERREQAYKRKGKQ